MLNVTTAKRNLMMFEFYIIQFKQLEFVEDKGKSYFM